MQRPRGHHAACRTRGAEKTAIDRVEFAPIVDVGEIDRRLDHLLQAGPWESIFFFMGGLAVAFGAWALLRLPETLDEGNRRPLTPRSGRA